MMRLIVIMLALTSTAAADPCKPKTEKLILRFQPDHSVAELADWLTATTCKAVQFGTGVPKNALKVTIMAPRQYTPAQAVELVVAAIEATGLRVKQGARFDIELGPSLPTTCPDATASAAPVADPPDPPMAGIHKIDDTHVEVSGAVLDTLAADPTMKSWSARLVPAMKDGKPQGIKLYAIRPTSAIAHLGFQNGDTILTVDGVVVGDKVPGEDIFKQARKRKQVNVEIVRRGKPVTMIYTIIK